MPSRHTQNAVSNIMSLASSIVGEDGNEAAMEPEDPWEVCCQNCARCRIFRPPLWCCHRALRGAAPISGIPIIDTPPTSGLVFCNVVQLCSKRASACRG